MLISSSCQGRFQSAPGDEAGRNRPSGPRTRPGKRFQSAPGDEAGRNPAASALRPCFASFNPLPAMKPGGTDGPTAEADGRSVSIRSRR